MSFGGQRKAGLDQPPLQRDSSFPRLAVTIQCSFPYVLSIVPFKFIYSATLPHTLSPSHRPIAPGFSLRSGCGTLTAAANHAERALGCVCEPAGMVPALLTFPLHARILPDDVLFLCSTQIHTSIRTCISFLCLFLLKSYCTSMKAEKHPTSLPAS